MRRDQKVFFLFCLEFLILLILFWISDCMDFVSNCIECIERFRIIAGRCSESICKDFWISKVHQVI